ncbi:T9SS type A sorting domain-containing protein, partial [Flavobacterium sp. LBUM151]
GVDDFKKLELGIYPNPVSDILNIKTQEEVLNVTVYDITGKSINTKVNNNQIDVSSFTKGIYIINIATENASYVQKFIKK